MARAFVHVFKGRCRHIDDSSVKNSWKKIDLNSGSKKFGKKFSWLFRKFWLNLFDPMLRTKVCFCGYLYAYRISYASASLFTHHHHHGECNFGCVWTMDPVLNKGTRRCCCKLVNSFIFASHVLFHQAFTHTHTCARKNLISISYRREGASGACFHEKENLVAPKFWVLLTLECRLHGSTD